jgi:translation elongation factor EF-Ts
VKNYKKYLRKQEKRKRAKEAKRAANEGEIGASIDYKIEQIGVIGRPLSPIPQRK